MTTKKDLLKYLEIFDTATDDLVLKSRLKQFLDTYDGSNEKELIGFLATVSLTLFALKYHMIKSETLDGVESAYLKMSEELEDADDDLKTLLGNRPLVLPEEEVEKLNKSLIKP